MHDRRNDNKSDKSMACAFCFFSFRFLSFDSSHSVSDISVVFAMPPLEALVSLWAPLSVSVAVSFLVY